MNNNVNRGNPMVKMKRAVWKIKVAVNAPYFVDHTGKQVETKGWKIKVILN